MAWLGIYFAATEVRLMFITGLVNPKMVSVPLREISRFEGRRSRFGRLIGYGEFIAEPVTPGHVIPKMRYMPYPEQLSAEIEALLHPEGVKDRLGTASEVGD